MMRARAVVLGVLGAACGPMPTLVPDAGSSPSFPSNVAVNGTFDGPDALASFSTLDTVATIALVDGRTGKALRFTTSAGPYGNRFGSTWKVLAPQAGTYCLTAWMKSTSTATVLRLYGAPPGQARGNMFTMPGPLTTWTKVPPNVKLDVAVQANDELFVEVTDFSSTPGTVIDLDDLDLWRSSDGSCTDQRSAVRP
ncbi:MAG: hypothetical protein SFW67_15010 [Myxococcaceae bacterium]|nr:hypothetical protein [Myxococcaceae bacterium]